MLNTCFLGDVRDGLRAFIAAGVRAQTCVTSPPYWGLRDYGAAGQIGLESSPEQYVIALVDVFRLVREVLADDGTLWLNLGDSYAGGGRGGNPADAPFRKQATNRGSLIAPSPLGPGLKPKDLVGIPWRVAFALQADGWYLRSDIIWHKPNPMPESATDRPTRAHDYLFLLTKSGRYYYDQDAIREDVSPDTHARYSAAAQREYGVSNRQRGDGPHDAIGRSRDVGVGRNARPRKAAPNGSGVKTNASFDRAMVVMPSTRNKRSVWTIPVAAFHDAHFATFPTALVEPCILAGSRVGDVVLDPFMGSGTVAEVAQSLGRRWIGCELNPAYVAMQARRAAQHGLALERA